MPGLWVVAGLEAVGYYWYTHGTSEIVLLPRPLGHLCMAALPCPLCPLFKITSPQIRSLGRSQQREGWRFWAALGPTYHLFLSVFTLSKLLPK